MRKPIFFLATMLIMIFFRTTAQAQDKTARPLKTNSPTNVTNLVYLADIKPDSMNNRAVNKDYLTGHWYSGQCHLDGQVYKHAISFVQDFAVNEACSVFLVNRNYDWFEVTVGVSDNQPSRETKYKFRITSPDKELYASDEMLVGEKPIKLRIPIKDVARLTLITWTNIFGEQLRGCWADARFIKGQASDARPPTSSNNVNSQDSTSSEPEASGESFSYDILSIENLARKLKEQVDEDKEQYKTKPVQVAVASFNLISKTLSPENALKVREQLSNALIKTKTFRVLERAQVDKILEELKRSKLDTSDSAKALKFGKQTNARAVLVGSISDEKTHIIITVRLINTETGEATIAEPVEVKKR